MAEQDPGTATPTEGPNDDTGDGNTDNPNNDDAGAKGPLADPEVQAEIKRQVQAETDRRVTQMQKTTKAKYAKEAKEAAEKATKDAERERLLADGNLQELADASARDAEEARAELKKVTQAQDVTKLLDKRGFTEPKLREFFIDFQGDLTELDEKLTGFEEVVKALVAKQVDERLTTKAPDKKDTTPKPPESGSLQERHKAAEAEARKTGDWANALALKNEISDQLSRK